MDRFQVTSRLTEFWVDAGKTVTVTNIGSVIVYGSPDSPPTSTTTAAWSLAPGASRVEDAGAVWVLTAPGTSSTVTIDPIASGLATDTGTGVPSAVGSGGSSSGVETVNAVATSGSVCALPDVATATVHRLTLTAATCTLTFPTAVAGHSFTVVLVQDATGGRLVTWPGTVLWGGGTTPVLTTTAAKRDVFSFLCADGTNWLGMFAGQNL